MTKLTSERLHALLHYEPTTGVFTWLVSRRGGVTVGERAGKNGNSHGYCVIGIDGKRYGAHRLAWLYVHGQWPQNEVDHKNGDRADNRIANLRDVTRALNQQNLREARSHNRCGYLGVSLFKNGRYTAQIGVNKRKYHLGYFDTPEEAHAAYLHAKQEMHAGVI